MGEDIPNDRLELFDELAHELDAAFAALAPAAPATTE